MLKSIYASQFYKYSKRQKSITAALQNPNNQELVMQLADALDEDYQDPKYLLDEDGQQKLEEGPESETSIDEPESEEQPLEDDPKVSESENVKKLDNNNPPPAKPDTETEPSEPENKPIEESTQVDQKPHQEKVVASTRSYHKDFHQLCDQVKGLLNMYGDTSGVNRILIKENELQIFYEDSINLNDTMGNVIELLNSAGYTYLEFNRLMRSSNAIVFIINGKDTNNQVKQIGFSEEYSEEDNK